MKCLPLLLALLALAGCGLFRHRPQVVATPHYVVGPAWKGDSGIWFYPQESFTYNETGLATVIPDEHAPLTTDGEVFEQDAMAAASQTLQLPAIATVTNLQNGRQVTVRVNDRGPASPARLIALTRRAAELLGIPEGGTAQVRVQVQEAESQKLAEQMHAPDLTLAITAAPRGAVQESNLPPPGSASTAPVHKAPATPATRTAQEGAGPAIPMRLPETVRQGTPMPGRLWIRADSFDSVMYADRQRAALGGLPAMVRAVRVGGATRYQVMAGPFANVAQADGALDRALRAGVTDARIVVE